MSVSGGRGVSVPGGRGVRGRGVSVPGGRRTMRGQRGVSVSGGRRGGVRSTSIIIAISPRGGRRRRERGGRTPTDHPTLPHGRGEVSVRRRGRTEGRVMVMTRR